MLIPLWGANYFAKWFELSAAALCSAGNIPYLQSRADFELVFLTKSQDLHFIMNNRIFSDLAARVTVKTITIDEFFPATGAVTYSVPLTLAYAKGIRDLGQDGAGTFVILMNADFVLSDGSLRSLFDRIEQGYQIITAPSIRVHEHRARPIMMQQLSEKDGGFRARDMMRVVEQWPHQTVLARIINEPHLIETSYYHMIFWRINESCLAARYFLLMPFCFQVRQHLETVTCPVDYGFLEQVCPGGRYTVLSDSDEFLMVELQHRDSEAYLLAPARHFSSHSEAIDQKVSQATENAAEWSTSEHRRAFGNTLLFHSRGLPAEIQSKLVEFDAHMSRILAALPPPVPVLRHYHWLAQLHHYRMAMSSDGLGQYPQFLSDECNRKMIEISDLDADSVSKARPQWPLDADSMRALDLSKHFRSCSAIVTLEGMVADLRTLPRSVRIFPANLADAHSTDMDIQFSFFSHDFSIESETMLGLYLLTDSLPHYPKFRAICDRVIEAGGRVIVLFRTLNGLDMKLQHNPWMLSVLLDLFGSNFDKAALELIAAPQGGIPSNAYNAYIGFVIRLADPIDNAAVSVIPESLGRRNLRGAMSVAKKFVLWFIGRLGYAVLKHSDPRLKQPDPQLEHELREARAEMRRLQHETRMLLERYARDLERAKAQAWQTQEGALKPLEEGRRCSDTFKK
jgi:hypothetical protein